MTRISQLISVVGGVKSDVTTQISALQGDVASPALSGLSRTYRPRLDPDSGGVQLPGTETRVKLTAEDALAKAAALETRLLDVTRTLDEANAQAAADVIVDGQVLLANVPTSHLLFLEKELATVHTFLLCIPVLDQSETWTDEDTDRGVHRTPPAETARTEKLPYNHVRWVPPDPTFTQPAQVDVLTRDEVTGYWSTVKFSGALHPRRKRELLDRLIQFREAVKFAREEANASEVEDKKEGRQIFGWLLRP